jgi:hypothetical protein
LAACLEYVGIHPFIVLCPGHAFVGYCRSERPLDDLKESACLFSPKDSAYFTQVEPSGGSASKSDMSSITYADWVFGKDFHRAICQKLKSGEIAALEATGLTSSTPFWEAMQLGAKKLQNPLQFDYLIDVLRSRISRNGVTPLPLVLS